MIRIEGLSYVYEDGTEALRSIDMDFNKGRTIGIVGANGSGKSTLMLVLMGVLKSFSGRITVDGEVLRTDRTSLRNHRKRVNMVFQDPDRQIFYSRVYDDVAFGPRNLDMAEEDVSRRVENSLEQVRMNGLQHKPVHFLSYGQKKRVSIAGILSMEPQMIIMDEPSSGLDPQMRESLKEIISLQSRDKRIVLSSHDMDFIYEACDYVYVIKEGQVIGEGIPKEVFLDRELLASAHLNMPWLVRIHLELGLPLWGNCKELAGKEMEESK